MFILYFVTAFICFVLPYTKHLKANIARFSDKNTAVQRWAKSQHDVRFYFPSVTNQISERDTSAVQTDNNSSVLSLSKMPEDITTRVTIGSRLSQKIISKEFKISIENSGKSYNQFTVLGKSESGMLTMELDENIIDLIEKRTKATPYIFVSLNKTDSGHLLLDFENEDNVVTNYQKVSLATTSSGTKVLEMHKSILNIIKSTEKENTLTKTKSKQKIVQKCRSRSSPLHNNTEDKIIRSLPTKNNVKGKLTDSSMRKIILKKNVKKHSNSKHASFAKTDVSHPNKTASTTSVFVKKYLSKVDKTQKTNKNGPVHNNVSTVSTYKNYKIFKTPNIKQLKDYSLELQKLFERDNAVITLQIETKNGLHDKFKTIMTKSPSGFAGIFVVKLDLLEFDNNEYPVCLSKTKSNTFVVNIDQSKEMFNAVLIRQFSGVVLLVSCTPQLKVASKKETTKNTNLTSENVFKLKLSGHKDDPIKLPAVLKLTKSNNFIIVLEKEFENRYKPTVQNYFAKERECFVFLKKTISGYTIDLNTNGSIPAHKLNALLVKSKLGEIKVLVQGPIFEYLDIDTSKRSSVSSPQIFGELLDKLRPASSMEFHRINLRKSKIINQKSASDTQLFDRVRVKLQISKDLFAKPVAILKMTESDQYAIILSKESKKTFINSLGTYLAFNSKGTVVPISISNSGEIHVNLDNGSNRKGNCGSLKITASGNVYILGNKQYMNVMEKGVAKVAKKKNTLGSGSLTEVETINNGVSTTCNAISYSSDCYQCNCVCAELPYASANWLDNSIVRHNCIEGPYASMCWTNENFTVSYANIIDASKACIQDDISSYNPARSPIEYQNPMQTLNLPECIYNYIFEPVCTNFKSSKDTSNKLGHKESYRMKYFEFESYINVEPQGDMQWDSLPHQLPPFLQDLCYR